MSDKTKQYIAWCIIAVAIVAAGFLGARYPIPEPPPDMADIYVRLQSLETAAPVNFSATGSGEGYTNFTSLSLSEDLYVGDDASVIGDFDAGTFTTNGAMNLNSTLDVDGAVTLNSTLDVDGNISSGTGGVSITDALIVGVDGTSYDVTFYSDTAGDYFLWDQANETLTIVGTNGQDALNVDDGNVDIADNIDVDGTTALDDLSVDGNITSAAGAVTITDALNVGVDGTSYDVTFYSDTAGDLFKWDQATEALLITGTNGQNALSVTDGNVDIVDTLDVDGAVTFNGTLDVDGNISSGTGGVSITDALVVGADGTSYDVTFFSDTAGDYLLWDQANEALTIIGTNGQDALNIDDGNVDIADALDVDGAVTFNSTLDVDGNVSSGTGAFTITDDLVVTGASNLRGALSNSTGAVTVTDSLYVTDTGTFAGLLLGGFANETITDGEWLTATVMVYALDSGGNVTMTLGAVGSEGQTLTLIGDDANTITIADTNIRTSDGNAITLGQYDVAMFVYQDSEWLELLKIANQ